MKQNYSELLKDPRWQRRKSEIMQRDNYTCQLCGCAMKQLHVHHKFYDGRKPWEYEDEALVTLCEDCHKLTHEEINKELMKEACIGKVYKYSHSDYTNYMICYDIDYIKKKVYLYGIDNGAGFNTAWDDSMSYNMFCRICSPCSFIFNDKNDRCSFSKSLMCIIYSLLNCKRYVLLSYLDGDSNIIERKMKENLKEMFDNNREFEEYYHNIELGKEELCH